jgi:predicted HicB family RNase H-like nuclease
MQARKAKKLKDFKEAVNTYLSDCKERGVEPERPFKGSINVCISEKLHRKAALLAMKEKISLNNFYCRIHKRTAI